MEDIEQETSRANEDSLPPDSQKGEKKNMVTNVIEPASSNTKNTFPELSTDLERDLVQVFKLLSDETRLRVLMYLMREKELHVTALCERLGQSQPAVSHHLALLKSAGLVEARRDGKHNFYSVRAGHFHRIIEELFQSMGDDGSDQIRFDDFVLKHQ